MTYNMYFKVSVNTHTRYSICLDDRAMCIEAVHSLGGRIREKGKGLTALTAQGSKQKEESGGRIKLVPEETQVLVAELDGGTK